MQRGKHRHLINTQNPISKEFNITVIRGSIVCRLIYVHIKVTRVMRNPNGFPDKVNLSCAARFINHTMVRSSPETMVSDLIKLKGREEGRVVGGGWGGGGGVAMN